MQLREKTPQELEEQRAIEIVHRAMRDQGNSLCMALKQVARDLARLEARHSFALVELGKEYEKAGKEKDDHVAALKIRIEAKSREIAELKAARVNDLRFISLM